MSLLRPFHAVAMHLSRSLYLLFLLRFFLSFSLLSRRFKFLIVMMCCLFRADLIKLSSFLVRSEVIVREGDTLLCN